MTDLHTLEQHTERDAADTSWWWLSGIGSVLVFLGIFFLLPPGPPGNEPADIAARYAEGHGAYLRAMYVGSISAVLQLAFVGVVSFHLTRARFRCGPLAWVGAVNGTVAVALQLAGLAVIATLAYRTAATASLDLTFALYDLSTILAMFANVPLAVFLATTSVGLVVASGRRWGGLVLAGVGLVLAVAHLVAGATFQLPPADGSTGAFTVHGDYGFLTFVAFLLWMLAVSIYWFRSGRAERRHPRKL